MAMTGPCKLKAPLQDGSTLQGTHFADSVQSMSIMEHRTLRPNLYYLKDRGERQW